MKSADGSAASPPVPSSGPPPAYAEKFDAPDITSAFAQLSLPSQTSETPTADECIAHLKLLEAFSQLREDVGTRDGLYGLFDDLVDDPPDPENTRDPERRPKYLASMREKRWTIFVTIAAVRFETWWSKVSTNRMLRDTQLSSPSFGSVLQKASPFKFSRDSLPPLDVLMVWHSFILNPRNYISDCLRHGKLDLWAAGVPWALIASCIDTETFAYCPGESAETAFVHATGRPWNSPDEPPLTITCSGCKLPNKVDWTTDTTKDGWNKGGERGLGFADAGFRMACFRCHRLTDHEVLRVQAFTRDVQRLSVGRTPMPGTILDVDGRVSRVFGTIAVNTPTRDATSYTAFVNPFIRCSLLADIADTRAFQNRSMKSIQGIFEKKFQDRGTMSEWLGKQKLSKAACIGFRRMMSCYWSNSSSVSLDLVSAVIRQGKFVDKMHKLDWLHSPSLRVSMDRFCVKYTRFVQIMASHPEKTAVPTLDVDLAWHTHQLNPRRYYDYTTKTTGKFIDHDDKIEEHTLSTAFEWTTKTYQSMFNDLYSECTCWYCESIRESMNSSLTRLIKGDKVVTPTIKEQLARLHATQPTDGNPLLGNHISTHNAVDSKTIINWKHYMHVRRQQVEVGYKRACQRAKKEGRPAPSRPERVSRGGTTYVDPYGYTVPAEYNEYPYVCDSNGSWDVRAASPGCAAGNCCQGTCGTGVEASEDVPVASEDLVAAVVAVEAVVAEVDAEEVEVEEDANTVSGIVSKHS